MKKEIIFFEDAIALFVDSCKKNALYNEIGNNKQANKSYFLIVESVEYLRENSLIFELKQFLNNNDYLLRLWSATFLLRHFEDESIFVLEDIASKQIRNISFDAKMVLQEWRNGNLKT